MSADVAALSAPNPAAPNPAAPNSAAPNSAAPPLGGWRSAGSLPVLTPQVGTVLAVPGRGEHPGALDALADRLALDGYRVEVLDGSPADCAASADSTGALAVRAAQLGEDAPVVLLGVDTGVIGVLSAVHAGVRPAGIVLAAMPGDIGVSGADEAQVRLHDPALRESLYDRDGLRPGELLRQPVPTERVDALFDDSITVPALVLHGDSDRLCPFLLCSRRALRLRRARVVSVADTAHDVLRDTHRASACAEVVLFAERLRAGPFASPPLRPSLRSTW